MHSARDAGGPVINTLPVGEHADSVRILCPERERLAYFSADARVVVSESIIKLPGLWREIPARTAVRVDDGIELAPFRPRGLLSRGGC